MTNDQATAVLALTQANACMARARDAFKLMGDGQSVKLMTETIDDNTTIITALIAKSSSRAVVVS